MERRALILAACSASLAVPARASLVDIDHTYRIKPVDQGVSNLCWLASAAMLTSSMRGGIPIGMSQLADELGEPWRSMYQKKSAILATQVTAFSKKLNVRTAGIGSMTTEAWIRTIEQGPALLLGYTPKAAMGHAIVLSGFKGETRNFETIVARTIDPNGAKTSTTSFLKLIEFYEGAASAGVPQLMFA